MKLHANLLQLGLGTLLLLFPGYLLAQAPEKVYSIVKESRPREWYQVQVKAWKAITDKSPKRADAWMNYYMASRMDRIFEEQGMPRSGDRFAALKGIVDAMGRQIPNSFEYNYIKWHNGSSDPVLFPYLEKAYQMAPDRTETYSDLVTWYEIRRDRESRDRILKKWFASGEPVAGLLNYNYNVLMSVGENGILLTFGDNDTYPAWILQVAEGIRKDVTVLNIHLLTKREYREQIFSELGIAPIPLDPENSVEERQAFYSMIAGHIAANKNSLPVYLAVTAADPVLTSQIKDKLYLVGLAYQYSEDKPDNMALLKRNFEQRFALDYLTTRFRAERFQQIVDQANGNYTVPMMHLYEHYKTAGEESRAAALRAKALMISRKAGFEAEVQAYFNKADH